MQKVKKLKSLALEKFSPLTIQMAKQMLHYHEAGGHKVTATVEDQGMKEGSRKKYRSWP